MISMLKNNKGQTRITMTSLVITIILVMALFFGTYEFITTNYEQSNITIPLNQSGAYDDLVTSQNDLNDDIEDIKGKAQNISEADGFDIQVAWNGLSGIAATVRVFFGILSVGINTFNAIIPILSFIPDWSKILIEMAIVIVIIFIALGALKGESKT